MKIRCYDICASDGQQDFMVMFAVILGKLVDSLMKRPVNEHILPD